MTRLPAFGELPPGGVLPGRAGLHTRTNGWRTGLKPRASLDACVNCMLCWVYCPDSAVLVGEDAFEGFDYYTCKGCEICAEICPVDAVTMIPEEATR